MLSWNAPRRQPMSGEQPAAATPVVAVPTTEKEKKAEVKVVEVAVPRPGNAVCLCLSLHMVLTSESCHVMRYIEEKIVLDPTLEELDLTNSRITDTTEFGALTKLTV